jgi:hypothetical protein
VTVINLPNSHLQYAITWYGLALALLGVSPVRLAEAKILIAAGVAPFSHASPEYGRPRGRKFRWQFWQSSWWR